jgi:non-canonical (house-cleaning) NTP pyrophosphatase
MHSDGVVEASNASFDEVLDKGVELGTAIDKFAGIAGIRDNQGAWRVLSNTLVTRRQAFCIL